MSDLAGVAEDLWDDHPIQMRQETQYLQLNKERPLLQQLGWTDEQLARYQERILGIERRFNKL